MRPHSRDTVRLSSAQPGALPRLDPNYLGDDRDLATMVQGLRLAREIGQAGALDDWRAYEMKPGTRTDDDAALQAYVRRSLASYFHPVGTCRIGEDALAVVDRHLRVHGVGGLRVADGSVMPSIPSANTNATVFVRSPNALRTCSAAGVLDAMRCCPFPRADPDNRPVRDRHVPPPVRARPLTAPCAAAGIERHELPE
ncbi:Oxygen-dependent choline dehydrogenase [Streptomyces sp. MBT84]|uniref:GMC oxidoreductase n=1 Tax=Streptomyces sp. MBT84 TaxID=1488414 RepID=UPI001D714125|nr:GMC oxidoreductase [Streptomyces sp. MBT84]MBW8698579.1 Oxygen-dependent choline dehydrogenase [Streptomyces sp. MBT84]